MGVIFMAKYSFEFKMKVVKDYINESGGYTYLSEKYGIPSTKSLKTWVAAYNRFGTDGLLRKRQNENYNFEFKISVVELYLTTEVSYQELTLSVGMNNPALITKWVNDYRIAGPDALQEKRKGRKPIMSKPKNSDRNSENAEYIKQLENDLLKLKIENAYLKELRRLRLEEEAQNKKQELSATSEDYSD